MSTISIKLYYNGVFNRKMNYQHLQSCDSSAYIILESKIPYYEAVTLTLPYYNSHMKKTCTKLLWKSENLLKITCRENSFMNASWTREYNCIHDAVYRTRRIAHNWHISAKNRRPCWSKHYPRVEDKLMKIIGTCTQCSDIYFDSMMSAFDDFIRRHRLKSIQSTSGRRHRDSRSASYAGGPGQYPRLEDNVSSSIIP